MCTATPENGVMVGPLPPLPFEKGAAVASGEYVFS